MMDCHKQSVCIVFQFDNLERKNYQIQVLDILGKSISSFDFNGNKKTLDITDFSKGLYIVSIVCEGKKASKKLVIK